VAVYYIKVGYTELRDNNIDENDGKYCSVPKTFLMLCGVYIIGISSIIRANMYYIDDMSRTAEGYKRWWKFSRYISQFLSTAVHMDNYLTDVSPLPQLISAVIVSFSGIILLAVISGRTRFTYMEILSLIPLYLNPYFLECISFKYDSPYMALSIFACVFPLLYRNRNVYEYIGISVVGNLIMCMTYQASSGIYPMMVIVLTLIMWLQNKSNKEIMNFLLSSVIGYGLALVMFKYLFMIPRDTYVSNYLPGLKEFIPNAFFNLKKYYGYIRRDFKEFWKLIVVAIIFAFGHTMASSSGRDYRKSIFVSFVAVVCMMTLCFGMYPILSKPLYNTRAMYGFGVLLTICAVCIVTNKSSNSLDKGIVLILCWTFFVFAFTYGNALSVQKEYAEFRINEVIGDLNDIEGLGEDHEVVVQIEGDIGLSPILETMTQNYQMLKRLMPYTFSSGYWGSYWFFNYYDLKNIVSDDSIDLTTFNLPLIGDHMYHTIYGNDSYILIDLK
jgi:hypothetical protein